jgi:hypothetical protein
VAIQIDMNPDGSFRTPERPFRAPVSSKILRVAILVTVLAAAGAMALLALWLALALIPIAIGAGLVAYGLIRYRIWKSGGSFGRQGFTLRR